MKTILPRIRDRVRVTAGWGPHLKRERVGLMLISLAALGLWVIMLLMLEVV